MKDQKRGKLGGRKKGEHEDEGEFAFGTKGKSSLLLGGCEKRSGT